MAEALFRNALADAGLTEKFDVSSFGTETFGGAPASRRAVRAAAARGADLSSHCSRSRADVALDDDDLIFVMTPAHLQALDDVPAQCFCIGEFFPDGAFPREVPDPFGGSDADYDAARDAVVSAFPRLLQFLKKLGD